MSSRCVSLANKGLPVAVCAPLTTQLLLPSPGESRCAILRGIAESTATRLKSGPASHLVRQSR